MRKVNKIAKALGAVALSAALALGCAGTALAAGGSWQWSGSGWWYAYDGGGYTSGWESIDGEWYLFDDSGWMETGWQQVGGQWYYLKGSGAMAEGWVYDGSAWYYLEPGSGAMATGWRLLDGAWYWLAPSGAMATGWISLEGETYYLGAAGAMAVGWHWIDGRCYWFAPSGALARASWVDEGRYWVNDDGAWVPEADRTREEELPVKGSLQEGSLVVEESESHEHRWTAAESTERVWVVDAPASETPVHERMYLCSCGFASYGDTGLVCILSHQHCSLRDYRAGITSNPCGRYEVRRHLKRVDRVPEVGHYEERTHVGPSVCEVCGAAGS